MFSVLITSAKIVFRINLAVSVEFLNKYCIFLYEDRPLYFIFFYITLKKAQSYCIFLFNKVVMK